MLEVGAAKVDGEGGSDNELVMSADEDNEA